MRSKDWGSRGRRRVRIVGMSAVATGVVLMVGAFAPLVAGATSDLPSHKITICHATSSAKNPYREITVDFASVLQGGHGRHGRDIIPAFSYGDAGFYPGLNWPAGAVTLGNHCNPTTTTSSTSSSTSSSTASTSSTTVPPSSTSTSSTSTSTTSTSSTSASTTSTSTTQPEGNESTSTTVPNTVTTAGNGTTDTTATTDPGTDGEQPSSTTVGGASVAVTPSTSGTRSTAAGDDRLPFTGGDSVALAVFGGLFVAFGTGLLLTRRRAGVLD